MRIKTLSFILIISTISIILGQEMSSVILITDSTKTIKYKNKIFNCEITTPKEDWIITPYDMPFNKVAPELDSLINNIYSNNNLPYPLNKPFILVEMNKDNNVTINIVAEKNNRDISIGQYDKNGERLLSLYAPDYKVLSKKSFKLNDNPAIKTVFEGTSDGIFVNGQKIIVMRKSFFFIINCMTLPEYYNDYVKDIDSIISSFKFLK